MAVLESVACRLCHNRKVKCDKTRPGCKRCVQYGKPCPGYAVSQTFTFVEHTMKSRKTRPSQTPSPSSDGSASDPWDKLHSRVLERSRGKKGSRSPPPRTAQATWQNEFRILQRKDSKNDVQSTPSTPPTPGPGSLVSFQPAQRTGLFANLLGLLRTNDKISAFNNSDLNGFPAADIDAPCVHAAMNALCYVGIGTAYDDRDMVVGAMHHYDFAVRELGRQIKIGPHPRRFRPVITSMLMLRHCELFSTFSKEMGKVHDWRAHISAMQQYVDGCGTEDMIHDEYDWKLLQAVRFHSLFLDMDQKRPSMFAQPKWLALTAERAQWDPHYALYDLRVQVGGLLARVERMVIHGARQPIWKNSALQTLLEELFALRDLFAAWMENHGRMHVAEQSVLEAEYTVVSTHPAATGLFATCFTFTDEEWASLCTTCWLWSLRLDCAILRLMDTFDATAVTDYKRHEVAEDANTLAVNICRSVYWCCQPEIAQSPEVGIFHLNNAQSYFKLVQSQQGLAWCAALMEVVNLKGQNRSETEPAVRFALALSQKGFSDRLHNSRWVQAAHSHRTIWEAYEQSPAV